MSFLIRPIELVYIMCIFLYNSHFVSLRTRHGEESTGSPAETRVSEANSHTGDGRINTRSETTTTRRENPVSTRYVCKTGIIARSNTTTTRRENTVSTIPLAIAIFGNDCIFIQLAKQILIGESCWRKIYELNFAYIYEHCAYFHSLYDVTWQIYDLDLE
jgi:hypothetical protein